MTRSARRPAALALLLLLGSCQDRPSTPVAPPPERVVPSFALADGAHGGNPHFFFLPPLVPTRPSFGGSFDASVLSRLRVEVCALAGTSCGSTVATLSSSGSPAYARIRLDAVRQFYLVYWSSAAANVATHYRVQVWLDQTRLGFADVDVVATAGQLAGVNRSQYVGLKKGDYLPVIFRVEQGALQTNRAPTLTITAPENNASFPVGSSVTFSATATDAEDGDRSAQIAWSEGATPLGTGASLSTSSLGVGAHTLTARVSDTQGLSASASVTIQITNRAPVVEITAPAEGSSFGVGVPITFTGLATDAESGVLSASIVWRSSVNGPLGTGASVSTSTLSAGTHKILASVADPHGAMDEDTLTVVITNSAPTVTISAPANNASFPVGTSVTFTGSATDPEQGSLTGSLVWRDGAVQIGTGGSFSLSTLGVGPHTITASVTDAQGNTSSASVGITITNSAPVVTISAPANNASFAVGGSVSFSGTATDAESGVLTSSLVWREGATQLGTGGSFSLSSLAPGAHTIIASATDPQGLVGSDTVTLTITNTAPVVTITAPTAGQSFAAGASVTFSATATDAESGNVAASLVWREGTTRLGTGASFSLSTLGGGTHTVIATAADAHGLTASDTVTFSIAAANRPPTATISAPTNGQSFPQGATIQFSGSATDPEQGALTGNALVWKEGSTTLGTGGSLSLGNLGVGSHTITLTATDAQGLSGSASVGITVGQSFITAPASLSTGLGQTISIPITLTNPAPSGGLTLSVQSADAGKVEVLTPTVTIPANALAANAQVRGKSPGTAAVTVSNASYGSAQTQVTTTATLNILEGGVSFNPTFGNGQLTVRLENGGAGVAAPDGGVQVTLTVVNPACVSVPGTVTIPAGLVSTTAPVSYGGSATRPCNTTVTAGGDGLTSDAVSVSVSAAPTLQFYTYYSGEPVVGSGLVARGQNDQGYQVYLSEPSPAPLTVKLKSGNPGLVKLSLAQGDSVGRDSILIALPAGRTNFEYYIHGMEGQTGTATISASAPGFTGASKEVPVVAPLVALQGLSDNMTTTSFSANTPFSVVVGPRCGSAGSEYICQQQRVRPGGTPVTVTVANGNGSVAQLLRPGQTGQSLSLQIPVGSASTPYGVASGGFEFDPIGAGSTTVSVSAPSFTAAPNGGSATIMVTAPSFQFDTYYTGEPVVGSGLMSNGRYDYQQGYQVNLGASDHGGVTVKMRSSNPSLLRLSVSRDSVGRDSILVPVANGQTTGYYVIHGMENQTGTANVVVSAPGFTSTSKEVQVTTSLVALQGLSNNMTTTTFSSNTPFSVVVGPACSSGASEHVCQPQAIRTGGTAVTVTVANSNSTVAQLLKSGASGQSLNLQIQPGQSGTPYGVANGGFEFDPIGAGSTTVNASAPGYTSAPNGGSATINVTAPSFQFDTYSVGAPYVGAGLVARGRPGYSPSYTVSLGASDHGGVTVKLKSSNPSVLKLSIAHLDSVGRDSILVPLSDGQTQVQYFVHGMENRTGTASIVVSAPGFTDASIEGTVVPRLLAMSGVPGTTTTFSASSPFHVYLAPACSSRPTEVCDAEQPIRPGGTPVTVMVTNSHNAVAQLLKPGASGQSLSLQIPVGSAGTGYGVANGGLDFDPLGAGSTTVSISAPGVTAATNASSQTVTVTAPTFQFDTYSVGAPYVGTGLVARGQSDQGYRLVLGASDHGGVTVKLKSSNPAVLKLSIAHVDSVGRDSILVTVPNGQTEVRYFVHGMEGQTGTVTITASAPGFTNATIEGTVVPRLLGLSGVPTSTSASAGSIGFAVYLGPACQHNSAQVCSQQALRPGASPITVTVTNSNAAVAQLLKPGQSGQSLSLQIQPKQSSTPYYVVNGGFEFDPLAAGTTTVNASAPGLTLASNAGAVTVTVSP